MGESRSPRVRRDGCLAVSEAWRRYVGQGSATRRGSTEDGSPEYSRDASALQERRDAFFVMCPNLLRPEVPSWFSVRQRAHPSESMVATARLNSDIYVVSATVIPVFFVALMMPGGTLRHSVVRARGRHHEAEPANKLTARVAHLAVVAVTLFLYMLFVGGELEALAVLDTGAATAFQHALVVTAVEVMTLVTAVSALFHVLADDEKAESEESP